MNIGETIPRYRVPTLMYDRITTSSLRDFKGEWVVLTSMFNFGEVEAIFCDRQYETFRSLHASLLILIQQEYPFHQAWHQRVKQIKPPLLADPSHRLSRILDLTNPLPLNRCETLFVDPESRIQFRLIHDLNLRMIKSIRQILQNLQIEKDPLASQDVLEPLLLGTSEE